MQDKGITFHITNEKEACNFLKYNNYYFKLKSYGKNYDKYLGTAKKGQYINLEFAYLQELSTLDMYLRKLILSMALNIEHALKTQLLYNLSQNETENGYDIVQQYLDKDYMRVKSLHDKIGKSVASDLIQKKQSNDDCYALWELQWLFNVRMLKHIEYFSKNATIIESYNFTSKIVNYFCEGVKILVSMESKSFW